MYLLHIPNEIISSNIYISKKGNVRILNVTELDIRLSFNTVIFSTYSYGKMAMNIDIVKMLTILSFIYYWL